MNTNTSTPIFEEIVSAYDAKVYKLCWYLLKNRSDAQDCTQDIFIAIFQALPNFKQESSLNTWVYRISTNKCYEYLRHKKRKKRFGIHVQIDQFFSQTIASQQQNPEESALAAEKSLYFWKAVDTLPLQQHIAYTLSNVEDMSYQEIAAALQTSVSAVESLLFRARRKLAEALAAWDNKKTQV